MLSHFFCVKYCASRDFYGFLDNCLITQSGFSLAPVSFLHFYVNVHITKSFADYSLLFRDCLSDGVSAETFLLKFWSYSDICHWWNIYICRGYWSFSVSHFHCFFTQDLLILSEFDLIYFCHRYLGGLMFLMYKLPFVECLMFGALISATDPVTVLSIFQVICCATVHIKKLHAAVQY